MPELPDDGYRLWRRFDFLQLVKFMLFSKDHKDNVEIVGGVLKVNYERKSEADVHRNNSSNGCTTRYVRNMIKLTTSTFCNSA